MPGNRIGIGGVDEREGAQRRETDINADDEIVARVRAGDRDAYADLVRRHTAVAMRTALLLGAGSDAEDVVQESFVKAYRALGGFRTDTSFRPWLLRIVANETRNLHRATRRRTTREGSWADRTTWADTVAEAVDPAASVISAERRTELLQAMERLTEPYRRVVTCRYLLDLDVTETATVLGLPRGTVRSQLYRALKRLAVELCEPLGAEPEVRHGT